MWLLQCLPHSLRENVLYLGEGEKNMKHECKSLFHHTLKPKASLFKDKERVLFHNTICISKKLLQEFLILYTGRVPAQLSSCYSRTAAWPLPTQLLHLMGNHRHAVGELQMRFLTRCLACPYFQRGCCKGEAYDLSKIIFKIHLKNPHDCKFAKQCLNSQPFPLLSSKSTTSLQVSQTDVVCLRFTIPVMQQAIIALGFIIQRLLFLLRQKKESMSYYKTTPPYFWCESL